MLRKRKPGERLKYKEIQSEKSNLILDRPIKREPLSQESVSHVQPIGLTQVVPGECILQSPTYYSSTGGTYGSNQQQEVVGTRQMGNSTNNPIYLPAAGSVANEVVLQGEKPRRMRSQNRIEIVTCIERGCSRFSVWLSRL